MKPIDVGQDFYFRLANRNELQGDGKHTAVEFRKKYLSSLDSKEAWANDRTEIVFDFSNVKRIGPSFANEAFAYFMKYTTPDKFLKKVSFENINIPVDLGIIKIELEGGYRK